ncbi:hypothetical protein BX600DRAFT_161402 [Xylariales sp. PMI_506]|nr:hypothetical protein BX600DRAFT_161402 [Xylariales sp. PMI_506]
MLPYVEVSHLPSAASFYSAVTHPLGLRYIGASPASIVYGETSETDPTATHPVFELRNASDRAEQPQQSRLVLSAPSSSVVSDFYAAALRANPDLKEISGADNHFLRHTDSSPSGGGESRAKIEDLEGNIMEVVYIPPSDRSSRHGSVVSRRTHSTTEEVSRILDWNQDIAPSHHPKSVISGAGGGSLTRRPAPIAHDEPPPILRRAVTTTTIETSPTARENSSGLSAGAVVGTVLGAVAAGAALGGALTYMSMKNQREHAPRQEFDAPAFQRRSTFPDPFPNHKPRYVEVERTVQKIHYPEEYPPVTKSRHYPPPSYVARYSQVGGPSREVEELDDRSSRHSRRHSVSGRSRASSEASSTRRPMMIADAEYRSIDERSAAGSRYTTAPKMIMDSEQRSYASSRHSSNLLPEADHWSRASKHTSSRSSRYQDPEAETYISTPRSMRRHDPEVETYISAQSQRSRRSSRSEKSESTIRPAAQSVMYEDIAIRSRAPSKAASGAPSRHSTATVKMARPHLSRAASHASARMVPLPASHVGSHATARMVPLPESYAGSHVTARMIPLPESHGNWDDDNDSIAPSDSISCVGSRSRSGRSYH